MKLIGVQAAYDRGYTGKGVVVGVVDSGAQMDHPDLIANLTPYSLDSFTGVGALVDEHGHGTHVAGTIAAARDGRGVQGVAYDAKLTILRLLDKDNAANTAPRAIPALYDFALARGVSIFNNSWGCCEIFEDNSPSEAADVATFLAGQMGAYRKALAADAIMIWATGNEFLTEPGVQAGLPHYFPEFQSNWIAVTAVGPDGNHAPYGNQCGLAAAWCMAAPGGREPLPTENVINTFIVSDKPGSGLDALAGTSMAAPHVSGAVAIARQMFPNASGADLTYLTLATATDKGAPGIDKVYGWGLLSVANLAATRDAQAASVFANAQWAARQDQDAVADTVQARFGQIAPDGPIAWGAALGRRAQHDATASSFEAEADTAGFVMGVDAGMQAFSLGVAVGYTQTEVSEAGSRNQADLKAFHGVVYGEAQRGQAFAQAMMGLQVQRQSFSRVAIPGAQGTVLAGLGLRGSAKTDAIGLTGSLRAGWRFDTGLGTVSPVLNARMSNLDTDAFEEKGADVFSLGAQRNSSTRFAAGPGVEWAVKPITTQAATFAPSLTVTYDQYWGDTDHAFDAQLLGSVVPGEVGDLGDGAMSVSGQVLVTPNASAIRGFVRGQYTAMDKAEAYDLRLGFSASF